MSQKLTTFKTVLVLLLGALLFTQAAAQRLPLVPLPDDGERAFWWYYQVQEEAPLRALQEIVGAAAVPIAAPPAEPISIAVIYPSLDVSDAWLRGYLAMIARLTEMGLPFEAVQFASGINDHLMQATFTEQVINDDYEYVIYGPTELLINAENIRDLVAAGKKVIIFTYDQVLQTLGDDQPMMYAAFSHYDGSQIKCNWVLENLGTSGSYAVMRGVPGLVDDQRSGGFIDCLTANSEWQLAYEHYGNFEREGGFNGTQQVLTAYPEVTLVHNANTAMAMGTLSAVLASSALDRVTVSGWGGTGDELDALVRGELSFTPMRMADDLGVAMAEAIRYDVEGRAGELPLVFLGRMTIATGDMSEAEIRAMREVAFRYTGVAALER